MKTALHELLDERVARDGNAPALTYKSQTWSYAELRAQVGYVANGLRWLGVGREDRVAVFLEKRLETVAALFGASAAGGAFVPANPLLRPAQVAHILADCDVRVLVTSAERLALLRDELGQCPALRDIVLVPTSSVTAAQAPHVPSGAGAGRRVHAWSDVFVAGVDAPPARRPLDVDLGAILYTSGSTGKPKGVMLSHRNLIVGAESVTEYLGNDASDVILSALPLSFDAGLSQVTTAFSAGAHVVLMNYLLPRDVVRLCAKHKVTGLTCVPPLWIQIAEQDWPAEASQALRYFANTGGRMPKATLDRLRACFPRAKPYLMYGLTEAFRSTYLDPDQVDIRPDSIGKAIPNAEILVARPDGTQCAAGEEGELVHRGALVTLGYWNDPDRTAERFRPIPGSALGGRPPELAVWSGDTVFADEEGYLFFVGRKDDMIKTSGYRVSPTEIEEVAYVTGLVGDAVAIGVDDPALGQRVVLFAAPRAGSELDADALLAALRQQMPLYMVPSQVVIREALPRTPNGKFDRNLLRSEGTTSGPSEPNSSLTS